MGKEQKNAGARSLVPLLVALSVHSCVDATEIYSALPVRWPPLL